MNSPFEALQDMTQEERAQFLQKQKKRQPKTYILPVLTDDAQVEYQPINEAEFAEMVKDRADKEFIFKAPPAPSLKTNNNFIVMTILPLYDFLRYTLPISHLTSDSSAWKKRKTYPENVTTPATAGFKKKSDGELSLRIHSDRGYQGRMNSYAAMHAYLQYIGSEKEIVLTQAAQNKNELNAMANRMVAVMMVTEARENKDDLSNDTNFEYYFTKSCNRVTNPAMNFKFDKKEVKKQIEIFQEIHKQLKLDKSQQAQVEDTPTPTVGRKSGDADPGIILSEGADAASIRLTKK